MVNGKWLARLGITRVIIRTWHIEMMVPTLPSLEGLTRTPRVPGRYTSTGTKDTMSATVKPVKEFHELDVAQPTAARKVRCVRYQR